MRQGSSRCAVLVLVIAAALTGAACTWDSIGALGDSGVAESCLDQAGPRPTGTGDVSDMTMYLNWYRTMLCLNPVTEDPVLNDACQAHADYMALNGIISHFEDPGLPGYTPEGAAAGPDSVLAAGMPADVTRQVDGWMFTLFHRLPLIEPGLTAIGVGWAVSGGVGYSCLEYRTHTTMTVGWEPIPFPVNGETGVWPDFCCEEPNPLPPGTPEPTGTPVSLTFEPTTDVGADIEMTVSLAGGDPLDGFLRRPGDSVYDGNTVSFIPRSPLLAYNDYDVAVSGTVNGLAFTLTWTFTTGN